MKIEIDPAKITATVYSKTASGIMFVKVNLPDIGLYINSFTVRASKFNDELWIQTPAFKTGKTWNRPTKPVEFNQQLPLWGFVIDAINRAADEYQSQTLDSSADYPAIDEIFPGAEELSI